MSNARENVNFLTSADWDIAALRLANWGSGAVPPQVMLKQNWVAGDGGGMFRYDASDTTTADNGGTVIVDAAGNRWKRQWRADINIAWFCAGDGTDETSRAQAAMDAADAANVGLFVPGGYTIGIGAAGLLGRSGVHLYGGDRTTSIFRLIVVPTTSLARFPNVTNTTIENLTFDANNLQSTGGGDATVFIYGTFWKISGCRVVNVPKYGIGVLISDNYEITDNYIEKNTAAGTQNQAIVVSAAAGQNGRGFIERNVCVRTGINVDTNYTSISYNKIRDYKFGSGIVTEISATCHSNFIVGNVCHGARGVDVNGFTCGGIENWASYSLVAFNRCFDNGGAGYDLGGSYNVALGNQAINNGQHGAGFAGISNRYSTLSVNGGYSSFTANMCVDLGAPFGGTQTWGFKNQTNAIEGCRFDVSNRFYPTSQGAGFSHDMNSAQGMMGTLQELSFSATWDPANILDGDGISTNLTAAGARVGDQVDVGFTQDLQGLTATGYVDADNSVRVRLQNETGGAINLASGTLRFMVRRAIEQNQVL